MANRPPAHGLILPGFRPTSVVSNPTVQSFPTGTTSGTIMPVQTVQQSSYGTGLTVQNPAVTPTLIRTNINPIGTVSPSKPLVFGGINPISQPGSFQPHQNERVSSGTSRVIPLNFGGIVQPATPVTPPPSNTGGRPIQLGPLNVGTKTGGLQFGSIISPTRQTPSTAVGTGLPTTQVLPIPQSGISSPTRLLPGVTTPVGAGTRTILPASSVAIQVGTLQPTLAGNPNVGIVLPSPGPGSSTPLGQKDTSGTMKPLPGLILGNTGTTPVATTASPVRLLLPFAGAAPIGTVPKQESPLNSTGINLGGLKLASPIGTTNIPQSNNTVARSIPLGQIGAAPVTPSNGYSNNLYQDSPHKGIANPDISYWNSSKTQLPFQPVEAETRRHGLVLPGMVVQTPTGLNNTGMVVQSSIKPITPISGVFPNIPTSQPTSPFLGLPTTQFPQQGPSTQVLREEFKPITIDQLNSIMAAAAKNESTFDTNITTVSAANLQGTSMSLEDAFRASGLPTIVTHN